MCVSIRVCIREYMLLPQQLNVAKCPCFFVGFQEAPQWAANECFVELPPREHPVNKKFNRVLPVPRLTTHRRASARIA